VVKLLSLDEQIHGFGVLVVLEEILGTLGQELRVGVGVGANGLSEGSQRLEKLRVKAKLHGAPQVTRLVVKRHRLLGFRV